MNSITKTSRRSMYHEDDGIACGPCGVTAVDAEIVVDDGNITVFLHGQWVDAAGDEVFFEATKESTYDVYARINNNEGDFEENLAVRDRISEEGLGDWFPGCDIKERYAEQYAEIVEMIKAELVRHGHECSFLGDDEDDIDE